MIEGKELPHDLLAEKSLLGCMIFNSQAIDEISELKLEKELRNNKKKTVHTHTQAT